MWVCVYVIMAWISLQFTLSKWCINYKLVWIPYQGLQRGAYGDAFQLACKRVSYFTITFLYSIYRFAVGLGVAPLPWGVCSKYVYRCAHFKTYTIRMIECRVANRHRTINILHDLVISTEQNTVLAGYDTIQCTAVCAGFVLTNNRSMGFCIGNIFIYKSSWKKFSIGLLHLK